jgi:phosphoribosylanthranilate isomerase
MLMSPPFVKICGLRTPQDIHDAEAAGAAWVGLVFYPPSPRAVSLPQACLLRQEARHARVVALTVDASDAFLDELVATVAPDLLQLHGEEPPARLAQLKERFSLPLIKALPIRHAADLEAATAYQFVADYLLLDAPPPSGSPLPGGNATAFDWRLLKNHTFPIPWLLAGGLTPDNVSDAKAWCTPDGFDVSSGVERGKGEKDAARMQAFVRAVQGKQTV